MVTRLGGSLHDGVQKLRRLLDVADCTDENLQGEGEARRARPRQVGTRNLHVARSFRPTVRTWLRTISEEVTPELKVCIVNVCNVMVRIHLMSLSHVVPLVVWWSAVECCGVVVVCDG